jgi:hypothetical protein
MRPSRTASLASLAVLGSLGLGALTSACSTGAADHPYTFAVIGDVPYGEPAQAHLPAFIDGINADPDVEMVTHLGDIKSASTTCDDARLEAVRRDFDGFDDPLVYTPGDNEWTDCHRPDNGGYQPLERLAAVRSLFFRHPGTTLGETVRLHSQAARGVPENVRYQRAGLGLATLHVVGSNDDLLPWTGLGDTSPTDAQVAEEEHRMSAAIANVHATFRQARRRHLRGVVLQQQADMFDATRVDPSLDEYSAFKPLVQAIVDESTRFGRPVYLFNGDSHRFTVDRPLATGSRWLDFYDVSGAADNLSRVTVDGSDLGEEDWLKVTVQRRGRALLSFEQVPGA